MCNFLNISNKTTLHKRTCKFNGPGTAITLFADANEVEEDNDDGEEANGKQGDTKLSCRTKRHRLQNFREIIQ